MNSDVINHFQLDIRDPSSALLCSLELVLWLTGINESEAERCSPAPQTPRDSDGNNDDDGDDDDDVLQLLDCLRLLLPSVSESYQ